MATPYSIIPLDSIACWATWKLFITLRLYLRLQASIIDVFKPFLRTHTRLSPLEAKKQLDSLRVRKTDKIDAEKLAKSQLVHNRKATYVQEEVYQHLRDLSCFYQNMTEDLVRAKNRMHKVLQVTFPQLENLLSTPTGEQYWNLVIAFPGKEFSLY